MKQTNAWIILSVATLIIILSFFNNQSFYMETIGSAVGTANLTVTPAVVPTPPTGGGGGGSTKCESRWECTNWEPVPCPVTGIQTRECEEVNECKDKDPPDTFRNCAILIPHCTNGIQDADESDVDCGGATCPKCMEGEECREREDCATDFCLKGICVIPDCKDGIQNQAEEGIDCGGPCPSCLKPLFVTKPAFVEIPFPLRIGPVYASILISLLILALIAIMYILWHEKMGEIEEKFFEYEFKKLKTKKKR